MPMRSPWLFLSILVVMLAVAPARAQFGGSTPPPPAEKLVRISVEPIELRPGMTGDAHVQLEIEPGWHVNANPPSPDYMIATAVQVSPAPGIAPGLAVYPPARKFKVSFDNSELSVYDGAPMIRVPFTAAPGARNGRRTMKAMLQFQACNDQVCLTPAEIPFEIVVTVSGGAEPAAVESLPGKGTPPVPAEPEWTRAETVKIDPNTFFTGPPPAGAGGPGAMDLGRLESLLERGAWIFYGAVFLIGLALNLTPCVYPMLGVTVSIFGARRKAPRHQVIALAVLYVLGMAVTYTSLGLLAAFTGGLFGGLLQNPIVLVGIGVLLLALSLSMFGLYEFQIPPQLIGRFGGATATSAAGAFVSGLVVGVFAAPCIGPPIVALLALVGAKADPWFGVSTLFVLSMGLGAPYLVLGSFSNLLQALPRSGEWMEWVKKVFGILLAALGLFYASLALAPSLSSWILPVALLFGGVYLGFFEKSADSRPGFRGIKRFAGGIAAISGVALIATAPREVIAFDPFVPDSLAVAHANGRIAMLDFTATWCAPCHELERFTFTDRRVRETARSFRNFRVDLTRYQSPDSDRWRKQFGIAGVPTVLFLGPDGREIPKTRVEGFMPPDRFLERMQAALGAEAQAVAP